MTELAVSTIPVVETQRLILRGWTDADAEQFRRLQADPDYMRGQAGGAVPLDENEFSAARQAASWARLGYSEWAAEHKETGRFVGLVGVKNPGYWPYPEVSFSLHPDFWHQGLATEAARASLAFGFEKRDMERILAITIEGNTRSIGVMQRLQMTPSEFDTCPLRKVPVVVYEMTRERWESLQVSQGGGEL